MKQHFSKLLALLLTASLCIPTFSIENIQAAGTDTIIWSEEETIPVNGAISEERSSNFNEGWKFYLGDSNTAQNTDFIDSGWTDINLPHDFSISQDFISNGEAESGFLPGGTGWSTVRKLENTTMAILLLLSISAVISTMTALQKMSSQ